jgi:dTDP-glucose pyrophosphorylase
MSEISDCLYLKTFLPENATLAHVITNLDESHLKIVLVVSEDRTLLGTISDGDIRRGLLRGLDLDSQITSIVTRNPLVVPPEISNEMALQIMQTNKIFQLPVVDGMRRVVGLHLWDEIATFPTRPNLMVVMAGGMGTRLRPHTENCPKPMLPIAGKPMLEHIIERAKLEGFTHFLLSIHYLGYMIEDYFGNGERFGVKIDYLREQSPLGTAGALGLISPLPDTPFVVTNGDVITDIRYGELLDFHIRHEAAATMAVRVHEWQHPFGVVQIRGFEIVGFEEKPVARSHINAGVYVLDPSALSVLNQDAHCDMPSLFGHLQAQSKRTVAYPMHEPWLDVGRPDDLSRANTENSN